MNINELTPTQHWVDERSQYIGGSEVAAILGESDHANATPLNIWMRKKGLAPPLEPSAVMSFGHYFEGVMAAWFEEETGLKTRKVNKPFVHPEYSYLRGNIDRQILADPASGLDSTALLELKTTTSHRMKALQGDLPWDWYLQINHYLGLSSYNQAYLLIYERDTCLFHEPQIIDRNDELILDNNRRLVEWWITYMDESNGSEGRRPEPVNGEDALLLYPEAEESTTYEITPAGYALYQELLDVRSKKSDITKMEEYLKTQLKDKLGRAERLVCGGKTLVSWKSQSSNRLDSKALRADYPDLYSKYTKQSNTRRFICHS